MKHAARVIAALAPSMLATGCASMAQVTTLADTACHAAFVEGMTTILISQHEDPALSGRLANDAAAALEGARRGPRPFLVASTSGADYAFFVQRDGDACLLRLYGRDKGFVSYTNNLTYIDTRPLAPCRCAE